MAKTFELPQTLVHPTRQAALMRKQFLPIALFLLFFLGMALIQFVTPDMPDNDGFYHIKLAWLMRTEGLKPDFPYLPLSILNQAEFYDHHFLFHIALIPFTFGDLRTGAKWAAVTFASLAFLAVWVSLPPPACSLCMALGAGAAGNFGCVSLSHEHHAGPVSFPWDAGACLCLAAGRQV